MPEGTQWPIGLEEVVGGSRCREKYRLQQTLQSDIDSCNPHQHCAAPALFKHLECDGAGGLRDLKLVPGWLVHPIRSSTNSEQVSPLVISRWSRARVQAT